jgi:hypothetical protein
MDSKQHLLLMELLTLRETNRELFMDKLYDAITTDFKSIFIDEIIKDKEHQQTLQSMIDYFESKEEYEKCDVLLHLFKYK